MSERVKKTKTPAKPKATVATKSAPAAIAAKRAPATEATTKTAPKKTQTVAEKVTATTPTHQEIALLALQYWAERGRQHGQHEQDWLRAERELMRMAS